MSEKITRVRLGKAVSEDRTDWEHLRSITDEELEATIAEDADSAVSPDGELGPIVGMVFRDSRGQWRWRLLDANRNPIADSPRGYADRDEADEAIRKLRAAIATAQAA